MHSICPFKLSIAFAERGRKDHHLEISALLNVFFSDF